MITRRQAVVRAAHIRASANAASPACSLPAELLSLVFEFIQLALAAPMYDPWFEVAISPGLPLLLHVS